ncbi:sensor histidine kinase [Paenibacillus solisilvae]|uniref:histidine kinase n=1 Tax=Paenibacillus solisilvae TaxID=2486751 RepID=A0ABW0W0N2_9BACL
MRSNILFSKLLVSFVLVSIIPLLLTGWLSYRHSSKAINMELDIHAENEMEQKLNTLNRFFDDLQRMEHIIQTNLLFSNFLGIQEIDEKYYQSFMKLDPIVDGLQTIRPENVGITLINSHNLVYFYGYSLNRGERDFLAYEWMPDELKIGDKPFITSPHTRGYALRDGGKMVFSFVQRFWNPTANSQGILIIDVPVDVLDSLFGGKNDNGSGTLILDHKGKVLYPQKSTALSELYTGQYPGKPDMIELTDGQYYRMFYKTDPLTGWTNVSYFSQEKLYSSITIYRRIIFVLLLVSTLICLLASMYLSYRITHPIMKLLRLMRQVENGDLNPRASVISKDEIGQLGLGFNRMIRHIQNLIETLYTREREKRSAEISALQAQIKPHFLYNALESINALARSNKQHEISKQIVLLGKLLRFSISSFHEFVPIENEIKYTEYYLHINKLRMKENEFHFSIQFDERLLNLYTIKWILQPIVENAIIHGFEAGGNQGIIEITGSTQDDDLLITVKDNGVGIPQTILEQIRQQLEHAEMLTKYWNKVGLYNVQSRIRMYYGSPYGITIDSSTNAGTTVQLLLPRRLNPNESLQEFTYCG